MPMFDERDNDGSSVRSHDAVLPLGPFPLSIPSGGRCGEGNAPVSRICARGGLSPLTVRRIHEYVDEHIDQSISVKGLAKVANLSVCYFVRAFKTSVGITPHEYLMRRRVALAMRLLSATEMPLSEIAAAAGFVDQSHCSRRFRRSVGMSPRDYRQSGC